MKFYKLLVVSVSMMGLTSAAFAQGSVRTQLRLVSFQEKNANSIMTKSLDLYEMKVMFNFGEHSCDTTQDCLSRVLQRAAFITEDFEKQMSEAAAEINKDLANLNLGEPRQMDEMSSVPLPPNTIMKSLILFKNSEYQSKADLGNRNLDLFDNADGIVRFKEKPFLIFNVISLKKELDQLSYSDQSIVMTHLALVRMKLTLDQSSISYITEILNSDLPMNDEITKKIRGIIADIPSQ